MSGFYFSGPEVLFAAGYSLFLLVISVALELAARRTHRYVRTSRLVGFRYLKQIDAWVCSQGRHLWLLGRDQDRNVATYRADPVECNRCPVKARCTSSDDGRELISFETRWPYSEIERFQRGISLSLIVLALFIVVLELARHHTASDAALLSSVIASGLALGSRILNKFIRWKDELS
jgi:hypothetical protein